METNIKIKLVRQIPSKVMSQHSQQIIHARNEFTDFIDNLVKGSINIQKLIGLAENLEMKTELRKVVWMIFLDILHITTPNKWNEELSNQRKAVDFSSYDNFFLDEKHRNLKHIVDIDVLRTYQEIELFRTSNCRDSLRKILFTWSFLNPDISYIQGMNELAATIYYVVHLSNTQLLNSVNRGGNSASDFKSSTTKLIYDIKYQDQDVYIIYSILMQRGFKYLYCYSEEKFCQMKKSVVEAGFEVINGPELSVLEKILNEDVSHLKKRINKIYSFYLNIVDENVYGFLTKNEIEPYIFMFRWILCMLSREFKLDNLIILWDVIFAYEKNEEIFLSFLVSDHVSSTDSASNLSLIVSKYLKGYTIKSFNFLDYLIVAMMIEVRKRVGHEADEIVILTKLMNFTSEPVNIKHLIEVALTARDIIIKRLIEESSFVFI